MIVWKIFYDVFEDHPITNIGKHVFVMPKASLDNRAYVMSFIVQNALFQPPYSMMHFNDQFL